MRTSARTQRIAIITAPVKNTQRLQVKHGDSKGARNSSGQPHDRIFLPGDVIPESGIYEVVHDGSHRASHDVVMISSDIFPVCDTCLDLVRFRLVRTAPYIFQDLDFEEPKE